MDSKMVGSFKHLRCWLPLICAVALGACSINHGTPEPQPQPAPDAELAAVAQQGAFGLPSPSALLAQQCGRGAAAILPSGLHRAGSEFEADLPHNLVHGDEQYGVFDPDWEPGSGLEGAAYCIYRLQLAGKFQDAAYRVLWKQQNDRENLWIGLGNFSTDSWEWRHATEWNDAGEEVPAEMVDLDTGMVFIAFVMLGQLIAGLEYVEITGTAWDRYWVAPPGVEFPTVWGVGCELDHLGNLVIAWDNYHGGPHAGILRYSPDGEAIQQLVYTGEDGTVQSMVVDSAGAVLLCFTTGYPDYAPVLIKVDADGNLLWQWKLLYEDRAGGTAIQCDSQDRVLVLQTEDFNSSFTTAALTRLSPDGEQEWTKTYSLDSASHLRNLYYEELTVDQGVICLTGSCDSTLDYEGEGALLAVLDETDASFRWARSWHDYYNSSIRQVAASPGGTIVCAGSYGFSGDWGFGDSNCLALFFSATGAILAARNWGSTVYPDFESFSDVELQGDRALFIGTTTQFDSADEKIGYLLMGFDLQGTFQSLVHRSFDRFHRGPKLVSADGWLYITDTVTSHKLHAPWMPLDVPPYAMHGELYDWECSVTDGEITLVEVEGEMSTVEGLDDFVEDSDYDGKIVLSKCAL